MGKGRKLLCVCVFLFGLMGNGAAAQGAEVGIPYEESIDYGEIQRAVDDVLKQESFDFKEYIYKIVKGEEGFSVAGMGKDLVLAAWGQVVNDKNLMIRFMAIAIIGAVFTNFTRAFRNNHVAETSFYVTYLLLFSMISTSFYTLAQITKNTLEQILEFMKAVIPSYFVAVTFASGVGTSAVFYQGTLMLIGLVELLLVKGVLPLIQVYFVLYLVNHLSEKDILSKSIELLESIIRWILKSLLGAVTGYHVIQGLIVPVADNIKNKTMVRTVKLIPGVGDALGSAAETVLGAGIVLKNAIGAAGIFVLLIIMSIPLIRMVSYCLLYKLGSALVQPVSDKRITSCLSGASKSAGLLIYTTFVSGILFLFTILIVMATTNGRA